MRLRPHVHQLETDFVRLVALVNYHQIKRPPHTLKAPAKGLERRHLHRCRRVGSRMRCLNDANVIHALALKFAYRLVNQGNPGHREQDPLALG